MRFEDIATGQALPALAIPITVPLIAGGAIATRDYFPGHHDLEAARALGSPHIFMNILTTSALVQRFVEERAVAPASVAVRAMEAVRAAWVAAESTAWVAMATRPAKMMSPTNSRNAGDRKSVV